jgi:hypothetical protein
VKGKIVAVGFSMRVPGHLWPKFWFLFFQGQERYKTQKIAREAVKAIEKKQPGIRKEPVAIGTV